MAVSKGPNTTDRPEEEGLRASAADDLAALQAVAASWTMNARLDGASDIVTDGKRMRVTGRTPRLALRFPRPIRAGWYKIELDMWTDGFTKPAARLHFADARTEPVDIGFNKLPNGIYRSFLKIPGRLEGFDFAPSETEILFEIGDFRVRRVGILELAGAAWRQARKAWRKGPRGFTAFLGDLAGIVFRPKRFSSFRDTSGGDRLAEERRERYASWRQHNDYNDQRDRAAYEARLKGMKRAPTISIIMPVCDPEPELLAATIASVRRQVYPKWQLCIADDASTRKEVLDLLRHVAAGDSRILVRFREQRGHISRASNTALQCATGEWIICLDHDDLLAPHALAELALAMDADPHARLIYSDEDKITEEGDRFEPHFKPDWSPDLFHCSNYLNHISAFRSQDVMELEGWRIGYEGSQDYDLLCRLIERIPTDAVVHVPKVLYHWRAVAGSTARAVGEKSYAYDAGLKALKDHVRRAGINADVREVGGFPFYHLTYRLPEEPPLVSLIIPTRDSVDLLRMAVTSIREKTAYPNVEFVIVDNGSEDPATLAYLEELRGEADVRVIAYPGPFNYSAINNLAVAEARGEIIALVNNDIEAIEPDWLSEMVGHALRPEVGAVGAKLHFADGRIQHAGVIVGLGGVAGHGHLRFPGESPGYFGRLVMTQNMSAVTGAVLVMRKVLFEEVGGLEEEHLKVALNDVDLCLRLRKAGYLVVWTPFARLVHHESASRGYDQDTEKRARFNAEIAYMRETWGKTLAGDPYYSPNLDLADGKFLPMP